MMMSVGQSKDHKMSHMVRIEDLPKDLQDMFCGIIDDCVEASEWDRDLKEGFEWINKKAWDEGITIYELILRAYEKNEVEARVKKWVKSKSVK